MVQWTTGAEETAMYGEADAPANLGEDAEEPAGSWVRSEDGTWAFHPDSEDDGTDLVDDDGDEEPDGADADEDDTEDSGEELGQGEESDSGGGDEGMGIGDVDTCVSCGTELVFGVDQNHCPKCGDA